MVFPNQRLDSHHPGDDRVTEVPGIGMVPNRPCLRGRPIDRRELQTSSQRYGRSREESQRNLVYSTPADKKDKNDVPADSEMFVPKYHSPMQFLAESFGRRRCELNYEVTRQDALGGSASYQEIDHIQRHRFYARDQLQYQRSNLSVRRSSESIRIKREDSIELQREVPAHTNNASGSTSPTHERAKSTSSRRRDDSRQRSSPPAGPSPPAPVTQGGDRPSCKCPIGFDCPRKRDDQVDCRTLVLEFGKWTWDQIQERAQE